MSEKLKGYRGCTIVSTNIYMVGLKVFGSEKEAKNHIDTIKEKK